MNNEQQELILDHYKDPQNYGEIENPTHTSGLKNMSCGDEIQIDFIVEDEKIIDVKFSGKGCTITKATASMMTDEIKGKSVTDVLKMKREDIEEMLGITLGPSRLKCALLPLEAAQRAISKKNES